MLEKDRGTLWKSFWILPKSFVLNVLIVGLMTFEISDGMLTNTPDRHTEPRSVERSRGVFLSSASPP